MCVCHKVPSDPTVPLTDVSAGRNAQMAPLLCFQAKGHHQESHSLQYSQYSILKAKHFTQTVKLRQMISDLKMQDEFRFFLDGGEQR